MQGGTGENEEKIQDNIDGIFEIEEWSSKLQQIEIKTITTAPGYKKITVRQSYQILLTIKIEIKTSPPTKPIKTKK